MGDNTEKKVIRVGSRKSELALIQTKHVIGRLQKLYPNDVFEIRTMSTMGDRVLNIALPKIGEKSLFTKDLEDALRNCSVDFVVHSLKDLPTVLPDGMAIGAVLEREDPRDALVLNEKYKGKTLKTLPDGSVIGTSSLRRTAQIRRLYPHLQVHDIRGNLNTRLAKLDASSSIFAGIILAQAGLIRMGWKERINQVLEPADLLYAVGQGALAVECRSIDFKILSMLENLQCLNTTCKILTERSFLKTLGGGCSAPVAVRTNLNCKDNDKNHCLDVLGAVWSLDGTQEIKQELKCLLYIEKRKSLLVDDNDGDDDEESPRKKTKTDNDGTMPKQHSPKIISEEPPSSILGSGDTEKLSNLQYLIDVHGESFKRCPFYAQHEKDNENGNDNSSKKTIECPLKIPIGQDFMGKCPYVDTEHNFNLMEVLPAENIIHHNPHHDGNDAIDFSKTGTINKYNPASTSKCPFTGATASCSKEILNPKNCPFLEKNQVVDPIHTTKEINQNVESIDLPQNDNMKLFCGLFRHDCFSQDLFDKCQELGKSLANSLINEGALEVMKKAQQEIRENI